MLANLLTGKLLQRLVQIPFDSFGSLCFSFIGVSFPCLFHQAAFRFGFTKGYAYLILISTLFDYGSSHSGLRLCLSLTSSLRFSIELAQPWFEIPAIDVFAGIGLEVEFVAHSLQALILIQPGHRRFVHQHRHGLLQELYALGRIEARLFRFQLPRPPPGLELQPLGDSGAKVLMQIFTGIDDRAAPKNIHARFAVLDGGKAAVLILRAQFGAYPNIIEHTADGFGDILDLVVLPNGYRKSTSKPLGKPAWASNFFAFAGSWVYLGLIWGCSHCGPPARRIHGKGITLEHILSQRLSIDGEVHRLTD